MKLALVVLIVTALIKDGSSCRLIESPVATINIDGSDLNLKWNNARPDASGKYDGEVLRGWVNFPDDRTYTFNYYKAEETIYWDGMKGETSNIWRNAKCANKCCTQIEVSYATITVDGSDMTLKWTNTRPDASGAITSKVHVGTVNFPDDREYSYIYYKDEDTIYWDGDKGETSNIWRSAKCANLKVSCSKIENPSAVINLDDSAVSLNWKNNRPDASGKVNGGDLSGRVNFPDDREYTFIYYKDEETIYWDGDKGETSNIWKPAKCVTSCCNQIEIPYATISIDGSDVKLNWKNNRPDASGKVNGGDLSGRVNFPDDREYTFIYYRGEQTIYWDGDKGETSNIWKSAVCS